MAKLPLPLGTSIGKGRSTATGMQSLCNLYAEPIQGDGITRLALYSSCGRIPFSTIESATVRGQINTATEHFAVIGTQLYKINSDGTNSALGEIEGSEMVDMAYTGLHVVIVAELKSYTYDTTTQVLAEISDGDFVQSSSVCALASYAIFTRKDTGVFQWSAILDATSYDPLDFASAESEPDNIVAVRRRGNEIALLGTNTVEFWGLTGDALAPFARVGTAAANIGCVSRDSAILVDNGLVWVGRDGLAGGASVYRAEGYVPKKISTPQVDVLLEAMPDLTELRAFAYQMAGHQFYVLTHPNEFTLEWDISTGIWSWRKSGDFTMGEDPTGSWDVTTFALNGSKQIVGSSDGNLYQLDIDTLTDDESTIVREVTCPTLWFGGSYVSIDRVELEIETGVGLTAGQGSDPLIMMSVSKDKGRTWSQPRTASMGVIGANTVLVYWTRVGQCKEAIFKFRVTDPVTTVIANAWVEVS